MTNILVTGGRGLVGSNIDFGHKIGREECDLMNFEEVCETFEKEKPDCVIHCAGRVGGLGGNMNHMGEFFYENIIMNTNVLEAARKYKVKKVVSFLSTCIFPDKAEYPLTSDQVHNGPPHDSNYGYAYAKRMVEVQSRSYRQQYGCNFVTVVPTNIYGPFDNFDIKNGHVIPSLIHKAYLAKQKGTPLKVWGSGEPLRQFIYVKDLVEMLSFVVDSYNSPEPLILTHPQEVSIGDVATYIAELFDVNIEFDKTRPDGQYRKPADMKQYINLYKEIREHNPVFTSWNKGIKETVLWFNENYPNLRK